MTEREESDARWREDQKQRGWQLAPVPLVLRLPIIRWFRFAWHAYWCHRHADAWASVGIGIGGPNEYDRWILYAIYRGWA